MSEFIAATVKFIMDVVQITIFVAALYIGYLVIRHLS